MWTPYIKIFCLFLTLWNFSGTYGLLDDGMLLDPFEEVLDIFKVKTKSISLPVLDKIILKLFGRFKCTAAGNGCKNALCLSAQEIFNVLGITEDKGLEEDDFEKLSVILTYHLLDLPKFCHQTISVNQGLNTYRSQLQTRLFHSGQIKSEFLKEFLDNLDKDLDQDDDDDDHHDDDDDHKKKQKNPKTNNSISNKSQKSKINDHEDSDDDDDDDDVHGTKKHNIKSTTHNDNDDDHDDDNDSHKKNDDDDDDQDDDDHDDDDHDDDDHDDDDHDDDDDDDDEYPEAVKKKCLSANTIFDELGQDPEDILENDDLNNMSALIIYHLLSGARIKSDCRLLPRKSNFQKALMSFLNAVDDKITFIDFEKLMEKLGLDMDNDIDLFDDHTDDDFDDHGHRRRRDVSNSLSKSIGHRRYKRDVGSPAQSQKMTSKCYTPKELLSIHNLKKGDNITKSKLMEIAPTLISQQVSGACANGVRKLDDKITDAERFGYGTLAVIIVCLCSVVGALVIPCADKKIYEILLAIFIGLAVGSLAGDALLHLLPHAFGLHGHGGGDTGAQKHVWYALAAFIGIYVFYLLEMILSMVKGNTGHSHGFELAVPNNYSNGLGKQDNYLGNSKSTIYHDGDPDVHNKANSQLEGASVRNYGNTTLAIMVVVGDAIHNFADGLAIGAAFTQSGVVGLSTTITVFCHELPHELGDFAILLSTGIGMKKALMANFFSSLTAVLGLYIGLAISTNESVRQWIFAIAAGMFLYIALVDMLPQLIHGSHSKNRKRNIILNNIGIMIGLIIMLLLAVYEEKMMLKG